MKTPNYPPYCYAVLPSTNKLIRIKRFEDGYYKFREGEYASLVEQYNTEDVDELADILNKYELGVGKNVREAMEIGSMFGWNVPGADPDMYDEDGILKD